MQTEYLLRCYLHITDVISFWQCHCLRVFTFLIQTDSASFISTVIYVTECILDRTCKFTYFWCLDKQRFILFSGLQLIIIFPALYGKLIDKQTSAIPDYLKYFWPRKFCPTPWADTMNNRTLISFLDANLEQHNNSEWKSLFVSQG